MEKIAKLPRVVLSVDVLQDLPDDPTGNNFSHKIQRDLDSNHYVAYIEFWGCVGHINEFAQLKKMILLGLRNPDFEEKYKWLASKFNARLDAQDVLGITKILL